MRIFLIALLFAISYAQTEDLQSVDSQALKMAEDEGIIVDLSPVKIADKNWDSALKAQNGNLDKFMKTEKLTSKHVADVIKGAKALDLAEDKKNAEDTKIEEESINYIAAEIMENKKKIDKAIEQRDALIEKYVPSMKKVSLDREKVLNEKGEQNYQEHKKNIASQQAIVDETKQENKKKLEAKKLEIKKQTEVSNQEVVKARKEGDKTLKKIQKEMKDEADKTKNLMTKEIDSQRDKESRYTEKLQELNQKKQKIDEEYKSAVQALDEKLQTNIKAADTKYRNEKENRMEKAQKEQEEFDERIRSLKNEVHELQKHAVSADADLQMEKAKLGKDFLIERQKFRVSQERKLKDIQNEMEKEKKDALAKQEKEFKRKKKAERLAQKQRIVAKDKALKNQEKRDKKASDSLQKKHVKQQKATDQSTTKLNKVTNLISQLRNQYSTKIRVKKPEVFRRFRWRPRSRRSWRSRRSRRYRARRGRSKRKYGEELFSEDSSELEVAAEFANEDEDDVLEVLIDPLGVFLVLWNICALGMLYKECKSTKRLEVNSELTSPILASKDE